MHLLRDLDNRYEPPMHIASNDSKMLISAGEYRHNSRTSWRGVYKSFSASSRNSSGTDREGPNTTDPYPTASHPKRSRIMSTARSAVQPAIPLLVPGLRFSSSSPSGSSSCTFQCFSSCDTEIASVG